MGPGEVPNRSRITPQDVLAGNRSLSNGGIGRGGNAGFVPAISNRVSWSAAGAGCDVKDAILSRHSIESPGTFLASEE
jgi:hypothetical protein